MVRLPATKAVRIECVYIQVKWCCVFLHQFCDDMTGEWPQEDTITKVPSCNP